MSGLLRWRLATSEDRGHLSVFKCTDDITKPHRPPWVDRHPRMWEYEAQSWLRSLRPPHPLPKRLLVGLDADGLAAAIHWEEVDGPSYVDVIVAGVALRCRRQGGGFADEMMEQALDAMTARVIESDGDTLRVSAAIFADNHPSQRMCRDAGMRHRDMGGPNVQLWTMTLII